MCVCVCLRVCVLCVCVCVCVRMSERKDESSGIRICQYTHLIGQEQLSGCSYYPTIELMIFIGLLLCIK